MIWPRPAYANPQLWRTSPTSRTSTYAPPAFIMLSRKRNQEFLFQGVDLEVTFFGIFFVHLALYEQPHFLSVCGDSVSDAHLASRRYSDSLSLSLSPSSKSDPGRLYVSLVWFVSKRVRESRGFVESEHELQRYWINKLSSLTIDASTCMAIRKDSDWSEKSFPRQKNFENISLSRKRGILLG